MRIEYLIIAIFLIPLCALSQGISITTNENEGCIKAFNEAEEYFLKSSSTASNMFDSVIEMLRLSKNTYKQCIHYSITLRNSIKKAMIKYSSLIEAINTLIDYLKNNAVASAVVIQEIIKDLYNSNYKGIENTVITILNTIDADYKVEIPETKSEYVSNAKSFLMNFLKYARMIPEKTPKKCNEHIDILLGHFLESLMMIWTGRDLLGGVDKFLGLDEKISSFTDSCPETALHMAGGYFPTEWFKADVIIMNIIQRSGLIAANGYNLYIAYGSKNWPKAGAWLGLALFNMFAPITIDEDLLPTVYNS